MKNLIFDLGGVIIPLDVSLVNQTLKKYTDKTPAFFGDKEAISPAGLGASSLFVDYEVGKISSTSFRQGFRELADLPTLTDAQIDEAWNSLLLPIPAERIRLLERLAGKYRLFLLSNTNEIHIQCVNELLQASTGHTNLEMLFEKTYYSHLLGMRKPDRAIYEAVLADMGLPAQDTMFIDDNKANAEGASVVGITGVWLDLSKQTILEMDFSSC
jgi:putative hydrolase of the HAD superfamily